MNSTSGFTKSSAIDCSTRALLQATTTGTLPFFTCDTYFYGMSGIINHGFPDPVGMLL
jgi:hypothetical protein